MSEYIESETVLNSIISLLRSTFTKEEIPAIYRDFSVQRAKLPACVVKQIDFTDYTQMKPRHTLRYMIDIRFHPVRESQHYEEWGRKVAFKALLSLQRELCIGTEKIHLQSTEVSVVDDVTHLLLVFSFSVIDKKSLPDMNTMSYSSGLKH